MLVGYGEDEDKYRELVKSYGLHDRFVFTGARRDIPEVLSALDILLFTPIWGEALPIVMLEAMSMGKAIVASNVCSNGEIITHDESGLLPAPETWSVAVEKLDTDALSDSVIRLISNPALRDDFGKRARIRAEQTFSVPVIMKQLEELYKGLLREKGDFEI